MAGKGRQVSRVEEASRVSSLTHSVNRINPLTYSCYRKWKRIALMVKAKENPPHRRTFRGPIVSYAPPVYEPFGSYYEDDDDDEDEDPTYEDDEIVEILPRRRVLRR